MYSLPNFESVHVPYLVLNVASSPGYRFLRSQVRWSGIPVTWTVFHSLLWSTQSKASVQSMKQVFFWNSLAFFYDPMHVTNMISGISAFYKSSLYICKLSVHKLLKPTLKDFKHYLATCEMSAIVWQFDHCLALPFFGIGMKTDLFQSSVCVCVCTYVYISCEWNLMLYNIFLVLLKFYCVNLWCTMWWFDTCMYCIMITKIGLVNISDHLT